MQISSASLLAAQQARPQSTPQRAQPKPAGDDLFEPLFGKVEESKAPASATSTQSAAPAPYARPGSQIDIRI
ncbi:MAG: hypothetical protein JSR55_04135 [Proteobacteria bacterium]|nr:hypothetical protein [Pseudomonadota bacterium]